jgi:hypothetical protein
LKGRAFNLIVALSSLLWLATAVLWLRSGVRADYLTHVSPSSVYDLYSEARAMHFQRQPGEPDYPVAWQVLSFSGSFDYEYDPWKPSSSWERAFGRFEWFRDPTSRLFRVSVPYWPLFLASAILPVVWVIRREAWRRVRIILAAAFGLWPVWLSALYSIDPCPVIGYCLLIAGAAAFLLTLRDAARTAIARHRGPWPWQWRRRRVYERERQGRCVACGYDLRADPEGGGALLACCPECGTATERGAGEEETVRGNG